MKKIVYTAIFGDKDDLKTIEKSNGVDYKVFTDNPDLRSDHFDIVVCEPKFSDPVRSAKYFKVLSHEVLSEYDYSLWIDASITIRDIDVNTLFAQHLKHFDIAVHKHPDRNCIYAEAEKCIALNKDNPAIIRKQTQTYKEANYPVDNGLATCSIIYRRHSSKIAQLNDLWWQEICKFSRRDQLSFNYVVNIWGHGYEELKGHARHNNVPGFQISKHKLPDFINW